tara:strand:- start:75 stop:713 length:639 start_codon:yes stop_codon:yes gene_type:complete
MEYNTTRSSLVIPEYGRNIHKMIEHAISVKDREERNHIARSIVKVMGQVKPQFKEADDFIQSLWDHMIIISDFKLEVDSPYPYPDKEELVKPPNRVSYPQNKIRFRHYGKSIESFIAKACKMEDSKDRDSFIYYIANMMKKNYLLYNRDSVSDELIFDQLSTLSDGNLKMPENQSLKHASALIGKKTSTNKGSNRRLSNNNKKGGKRSFKRR